MKVSQLIKRIEADGWVMIRIKGSLRQFKHQKKKGLVTVPGKLSDDVKKGTLGSVLRQAKLK
jgi:predicted RNA binding protein YcfA (HicA-like mRNA interferase family)